MKSVEIGLIDNYDSFTFNLVHYFEKLGAQVSVYRNDKVELEELKVVDRLVLSPGPSLPKDAGKMMAIIDHFHSKKPILGVCLGMQGIVEYFGGELFNQNTVKHGIAEKINLTEKEPFFRGMGEFCTVGLYHSWATKKELLPKGLIETASTSKGVTMAIKHEEYDVCGVQFHPESILTERGELMLKNWLTNIVE